MKCSLMFIFFSPSPISVTQTNIHFKFFKSRIENWDDKISNTQICGKTRAHTVAVY